MRYPVFTEDLLRIPADRTRWVDNSDHTKRMQFLLSSISTGTDRTYTWPDADGTVALLAQLNDGTVDHGNTTGLLDDDHTQYKLVAGRPTEVEYVQGTAGGDYSVPDSDLIVGNSSNYGLTQIGSSLFGRSSRVTGNLDLDGTVVLVNRTNPNASNILFAMLDGTNSIRFALPKSATGNATYNPRSFLNAGPVPVDDGCVTVGYWQTQGIFHNLACDTSGSGADMGVQNDLEVEGDIFVDSIKGSTDNTNITIVPHGTGVVTLPAGSTVGGAVAATVTGSETLTNKTLTTPIIGDFTNATHTHADASEGGTLAINNMPKMITAQTMAILRTNEDATNPFNISQTSYQSKGRYGSVTFDSSLISSNYTVKFQANIWSQDGTNTAYAVLWDTTANAAVSGSEVSTTLSGPSLQTSGDIRANLSSGSRRYEVRMKVSNVATTSVVEYANVIIG